MLVDGHGDLSRKSDRVPGFLPIPPSKNAKYVSGGCKQAKFPLLGGALSFNEHVTLAVWEAPHLFFCLEWGFNISALEE